MPAKKITIKDLARILGLHHSTVSRALHDHPDISQETKNLVFSLAEELDYQPDAIAQTFRSRKSKTLGVLVPSVNDFFAAVIRGIEDIAYYNGYTILVCQSNESYEREVINIRSLISNQVAGVLVSISEHTTSSEHFQIFKNREIPLVLFDRVFKGQDFNTVVVDDFNGAYKIVNHIIRRGYRRVAHFAGPRKVSVSKDRLEGYLQALSDNNIPINPKWIIYGGFSPQDGQRAFREMQTWQAYPEAIFAVNDPVAIGVYTQLRKAGIKIPSDIALAGFGNISESGITTPPITTVNQNPYEIGKLAALFIFDQIKKPDQISKPREEILQTELIIRPSTAPKKLSDSRSFHRHAE